MKKLYPVLFVCLLLFLNFQVKAHEVVIKGFVKYANGTRVANAHVKIFVEAPCVVEHTVLTNNDGYYSDKISCADPIRKVRISIVCQAQNIVQFTEVSASNVVEANFTMCAETVACVAKFIFAHAPPTATQKFPVKFNSSTSETIAGDKVIERKWTFGDGETGNTIDPVHNYAKPGVYSVCLTIKTANGCISTKCQNVEIKSTCKSSFSFEHTIKGVRFNSSSSSGSLNDGIKGRTWNFGDGTPPVHGNIDPLHVFPHPGTYKVCLTIWTNNGCESKECKEVAVPQSATANSCLSRFSFERIAPNKFRFNSNLSKVGAEDHIVEKQWDFRDGTPVVKNNDVSTVHEFSKAGLYEVCLKIRTAKGCESRVCMPVKVEELTHHREEPSIKIVSLYPAPFKHELKAVIFSRHENVMATISIVDVYGQIKITKKVFLVKGNNPFEMETNDLLPGPYFFKISTPFGNFSKLVHKL